MAEKKARSPAAQGFRMPAEWEPHEATWIAWPHHTADWPGKFAPIPWVYAEIVRHLALSEFVSILVEDDRMQLRVEKILTQAHADLDRVRFFTIPTNRVWTRDYGPIFLTSAQ